VAGTGAAGEAATSFFDTTFLAPEADLEAFIIP
jgi:hypothetical protein